MSIYNAGFSQPTIINLNSKDRVAGINNSFISQPVDLGVNKYDTVCLVSASIPKSYYNFPSGYNTFTLTEVTARTITVPPGNYNKNSLVTALNTLFNTGAPVGWVYTIIYGSLTGVDNFKFTFSVTGNSGTQPYLSFQNETSPFLQLGFEENSINNFTSDTLVSTNAINLQYVLRMFIKTNLVEEATDSILEEILNVGQYPFQSLIYYEQIDFDMNSRKFNSSGSNSWQFNLVDSYNRPVDLNGISWSFSLVFYQRNDTHEIHRTDLEIKNEERLIRIENANKKLQDEIIEEQQYINTPVGQITQPPGNLGYVNLPPDQFYPVLPSSIIPKGLFINEAIIPTEEEKKL